MTPQHVWQSIVVQGGAPIHDTEHGRWRTLGPADLPTMGYHPRLANGQEDAYSWRFRWQGQEHEVQAVFVQRVEYVAEESAQHGGSGAT